MTNKNLIYYSKDGYNKVAEQYDSWKWQKFWHKNELPLIENWISKLNVGIGLDAGTGSGNTLFPILKFGHKVIAVDNSDKMLRICSRKFEYYILNKQLTCRELDISKQNFYHNNFDWITCNRVLSNIKNIGLAFKTFSNILKENGQCFISDIHPLHNYTDTNIPFDKRKIHIETYKHSIKSIKDHIHNYGFEIIEFKEIYVNQLLDQTLLDEFPNLLFQDTPIFYYTIIKKCIRI
ncbi:class I SAM-dependent methyltransferase [Saccharicrinis aurantiacus]|uniref:class I SAM-dependent methyltransferase n=1 Tax=Saccharicrinis aurantiacus TaxID=1849719 RepID=UPI0008381E20|nr:class I SAM-dependent methyltransferase [Saccharicrinis aurantiacus]